MGRRLLVTWTPFCLHLVATLIGTAVDAFQVIRNSRIRRLVRQSLHHDQIHQRFRWPSPFPSRATREDQDAAESSQPLKPQVFASGYSTQASLVDALREAVEMAVQGLPENADDRAAIDLAIVSVSSLYDGGAIQPATAVVPIVLEAARDSYGASIQHLVGCSVAGSISSQTTAITANKDSDSATTASTTVELEGIPSVSVTLALLPDVELRTFDVGKDDVPDDVGRLPTSEWKRSLGLTGFDEKEEGKENGDKPLFMMLPSPAFSTDLDDLLFGLSVYFPGSQVFGGISSTVSSLSRAKLYRYSAGLPAPVTLTDGCIGVAMQGDIQLQTLMAQGAKPVGGVYTVLKGFESTLQAIVLDEDATNALKDEEDEEVDDDEDEDEDQEALLSARERMAQAYAKARIPKPPLAEANFLMRTLSDDDQAFMRRQLLIGLETTAPGGIGRAVSSELSRLAEGKGHQFRVLPVASGGMKDGSVTFALGSVDIVPGTRMRFFVREASFAKREVEALWLGYKQKLLNQQFEQSSDSEPSAASISPTCCFLVPTLDRGSKFFLGKAGFESSAAARMMPSVPCVTGFFANGVLGQTTMSTGILEQSQRAAGVQGSASGYFLLSSKNPNRPVYSAARAAAEKAAREKELAMEQRAKQLVEEEDLKRRQRAARGMEVAGGDDKAPRSENGELILKRREVHSGRALTVSTVEWSVAEKTATPTSVLEGFMWEKETEVDRFRERVPLANLVSQCRLSAADPTKPKPRDFIGPIKQAIREAEQQGGVVIIPECKRMEPSSSSATGGSLWRRYDVRKMAKSLTVLPNVPAISVNCDGVLFGGSLEDITKAREAASAASIERSMSDETDGVVVPPILASDLLLYPYQLYKLRLSGADAVTLVVGALPQKDLRYLIKIAFSLQLQTVAVVNSEVQLRALADADAGKISAVVVSNRELEDYSIDMTGERAMSLLQSDALADLKTAHGSDLPVLVEGRVGLIEGSVGNEPPSVAGYIQSLKEAGASAFIVGGGLAAPNKSGSDLGKVVQELQASG